MLISASFSVACTPSLIDKMDKTATEAVSIGDWGEASYFANQMYELLPECGVNNLVSLSLIYNKLAGLATDIETRRDYVNRMIDCYEKAYQIDPKKTERKFKDAQIDMAENVRRNKQLLMKSMQENDIVVE